MSDDDEPEVQHLAECEHPIAPCTCPRNHLLAEARRIREMCLFAEDEFARENQRAVDLKIERDRLRLVVERAHDHVGADEHVLRTLTVDDLVALVGVLRQDYAEANNERDRLRAAAVSDVALVDELRDVSDERDRLRAVVDAVHRNLYRDTDPGPITPDQLAFLPTMVAGIIGGQGETLDDVAAERDRLRAVVEAVRHFIALQVTDDHPPEDDAAAWDRMVASLEQLDGSPTMGSGSRPEVGSHVGSEPLVDQGAGTGSPGALGSVDPTSPTYDPDQAGGEPWERFDDFYVCPDHIATGGYESCCACGGWADDDPDRGRLCSEASK